MFLNEIFWKRSSTTNQYLATFAVNILTLSHGCSLGWLSPSMPYLVSTDSHLESGPVSTTDISWLGSLSCVGGLIGIVSFGYVSEKLGKKRSLFLLLIPHLTSWILTFLSMHVYHLYAARTISGITGGGLLRIIPLFITEIAEDNIRGFLGSFYILSISFGFLIIFVTGAYLNFFLVPFVIMVFPIIFMIALSFLHDSPRSLLTRNKSDKALESLKFYRGCDDSNKELLKVEAEFEQLKLSIQHKDVKLELKDFLTPQAKTGLLVGLFLMFLSQFSGALVISIYTAAIFERSGNGFSSNESIIVVFIQLVGVYVSTLCVDRFGRKILMTISCIGTAIFLCILAANSLLSKNGFEGEFVKWIPVVSLSIAIFIASLGISSLPFIIITELLPQKVKGFCCTVCMSLLTTFAFIILKIFPVMLEMLDLHGCMFFFAGVCFMGAIVTTIFIPETNGKSLVHNDLS